MNKYTILEFIEHTKNNPSMYINYCEVIMDPRGNIIKAEPSHTEALIQYVMELENKSREEIKQSIPITCLPMAWIIDKYGLVAIWNCGYRYSSYKNKHGKPNRYQRRSLQMLINAGLIKEEYVEPATEYKLYLKRKSMGLEK